MVVINILIKIYKIIKYIIEFIKLNDYIVYIYFNFNNKY